MLFRKNKAAQKNGDDRELIEANSKAVEALIVLAKDNANLVSEFRELEEKLKYLTPSSDPKVYDFDRNIRNIIGDLRIALTKSDGADSRKIDSFLTEIKLVIADRSVRTV